MWGLSYHSTTPDWDVRVAFIHSFIHYLIHARLVLETNVLVMTHVQEAAARWQPFTVLKPHNNNVYVNVQIDVLDGSITGKERRFLEAIFASGQQTGPKAPRVGIYTVCQ